MALIGTLRDKMIKWVVGFVAIAISAFVLNDIFGAGSDSFFSKNENVVGEIADVTIRLDEYQATIQQQKNYYIISLGRQPNTQEMSSIRQQAWDKLILRYAIEPQYEEVNLAITSDEEWDMVQGKNIHEGIKQSFTDSTGYFDHKKLINYLQNLSTQASNTEPRARWNIFKNNIISLRIQTKFENLILKTIYVTQAESEHAHHLQNDVAEIQYIYIPFQSVEDSLVTVSESELEDYYEENKKKHEVENTRDLSYVSFSVVPSAEDSTDILEELREITTDFETTKEDSLFAAINSDNLNVFSSYTATTLPTTLSDQIHNLSIGQVIGPFQDGNSYKMVKITSLTTDTIGNARASHILIRLDNDAEVARKKAQKILNELKAGADFVEYAKKFGSDGTSSKGGDLGWFTSGQMVKPFQNAVFNSKRTGLIPNLIKTKFGYHIIYVTQIKNNTSYLLATIERDIIPGEDTRNKAYRKADLFASGISSIEDFNKKAVRDSIEINKTEKIKTTANKIDNLSKARDLVMWLFRDAQQEKVSSVFDVDDSYIVAIMTGETQKGYRALEEIKEELTSLVKNIKKGEIIVQKLNSLTGTLVEIADASGFDTKIDSLNDLKLENNSLPKVGLDPTAVGKAFALEKGERSVPFSGERGVFIIEMKNKNIAPSIGDYTALSNTIRQQQNNKTRANIVPAIKENTEIKDQRHLFY